MRGSTLGSPVLPSTRETTAGLRAALFVDQVDAAWFPREGYSLLATAYAAMDSLGSETSYSRLEASARGIESWGPHTFNLGVAGGSSLDSDMPAYEQFSLGGPLQLSAYQLNEFVGRQYAFGRLMYYNRTIPLPDLLGTGDLRWRLGRSCPHQRSGRWPAVAGNLVVELGLPRRGHVRRPAVPRRWCRRRTLESVPVAGRAVAPAQPPGRRG